MEPGKIWKKLVFFQHGKDWKKYFFGLLGWKKKIVSKT